MLCVIISIGTSTYALSFHKRYKFSVPRTNIARSQFDKYREQLVNAISFCTCSWVQFFARWHVQLARSPLHLEFEIQVLLWQGGKWLSSLHLPIRYQANNFSRKWSYTATSKKTSLESLVTLKLIFFVYKADVCSEVFYANNVATMVQRSKQCCNAVSRRIGHVTSPSREWAVLGTAPRKFQVHRDKGQYTVVPLRSQQRLEYTSFGSFCPSLGSLCDHDLTVTAAKCQLKVNSSKG